MFRVSGKISSKIIAKTAAALVLAAIIITGIVFVSYSESVSSGLADNLVRLHVLANSDEPNDQQLKRDVRDVVITYMKGQLKDIKNIDETKQKIYENLDDLREIAIKEIKRQGKDYDVKVMLGNYPFPTKVYGDVTLPAGNYQALRVVIGKGEGQNWWCVLFPPLCFVDATHGTVPDSVKSDLKDVLSEEEYNLVAPEEEEMQVEIKFKIVEVLQDSKIKFGGMMNRLFKSVF